ncbi:MAG: class I SAM-dependent methyltransferase [Clostridiales bacterium]|nr:class I SAM-dependent methyltransferase [Clostridiales bacterium]
MKMKSEQVKWNFSDLAGTYSDESRRQRIPCFDDFYRTGIAVLAGGKSSPRALDVGAGTGLYAAFLLERFADADVTLIDFSEEMLALAKERFNGRPNTGFLLGNYTDFTFDGTYDVIISALSIHHLNAAEKAAFYRKAFGLLADGGEFLNADQILCPDTDLQERYMKLWLDFVSANGVGIPGFDRMKQSMELDAPSTVEEQLSWLRAAGFAAADCVYKYRNFAVLYARK